MLILDSDGLILCFISDLDFLKQKIHHFIFRFFFSCDKVLAGSPLKI